MVLRVKDMLKDSGLDVIAIDSGATVDTAEAEVHYPKDYIRVS